MIRPVLYLVFAAVAFWALVAVPARHLGGDVSALHGAVAVALCLVPAVITLLWAGWAAQSDPNMLLLVALGSSGARMFLVACAVGGLYLWAPLFKGEDGFLFWSVGAYLFLLAVEVWALLRCAAVVQDVTPQPAVEAGRESVSSH